VVAGDSRDKALELARRMEDSRHFAQTFIETEHQAPPGSGDTVQFDIAGIYVPEVITAAAPAASAPPSAPPSASASAPAPKTATPAAKKPMKIQPPKRSQP
jgi:hypothetical protein